ncbi:uncharacterized protein LOC131594631 [Vicia villosa]|uniref:uncharacterized protein LOC131594631 n=1 Tax=Vicia villosa TaxID=3911 RepID=UPI00273BF623|nr:uncharacterized protein LOC131594631 [Vicia villosa]
MDGVLLMNELLDWSKRYKKSFFLLKVDFEKAYYSVSWDYLKLVFNNMGFGDKWNIRLEKCVFKSHMSILVNGSPTKDFMVHKGLRQGDPLSLFLFVLAMEGLAALVRKSVALGDFKPFKYGEEEKVEILQFAEDTIILGEPSSDNLWSLKVLLRGFETVSGIVVGANPIRRKVWLKVLNNIKSRLSSWKGRNISIGGKVTLINAVLNAIPSFALSFYKAPGLVIKEIRSLIISFLWRGNANRRCIHWFNWDTVCKPKEMGGLGIRDVGEIKKALLLKWKWRILTEDKAIWSRFLESNGFMRTADAAPFITSSTVIKAQWE